MKKVMVFALAVMLIMSMAISAVAVNSPTARPTAPAGATITIPEHSCGMDSCQCQSIAWAMRNTLPQEKKEVFEEAKASLKDAVPEGFVCRELVYQLAGEGCTSCSMTITVNGAKEVAVLQYVEGEWTAKSVSLEGNTATVSDVVDGPLAVCTK